MSVEIVTSLLATMSGALAKSVYAALKEKIMIEYGTKKITLNLPTQIESESDIKTIEGILVDEEKRLPRVESQPIVADIFKLSYHTTKKIRDERLRQARITFNWAVILTIIAVVVIFCGVVLLYWGKITSGVVSTSVGAVTEVIGVVLFKLNRDANNRLDEVGKTLANFEKAQLGMSLIDKMVDESKKDEAIRKLAKYLQN